MISKHLTAAAVLVVVLNQFVPAADICSGGRFNVAPSVSLGFSGPDAVAVADFNRDGKPDLAILEGLGSGIAILVGNGDGTFKTPINVSAGSGGEGIVVADFNGDGNSDLAVSLNADKIVILLGKGDGTFSGPVTLNGGGTGPTSLTSGDFNGDGKPDLALTNANSNNVSIFLSLGDGNFSGPTLFATAFQPNGSSVGDFNGDGKTDLAIAGGTGVTLLLGNGTGGFGSPATFATAGSGSSVAVADFNGDGKTDVAVAHFFSNTLTVLFGTGTGTLTNAKNILGGANARFVTASDLNGDGRIDLISANRDADTTSIFIGDGAGNFDRVAEYATGAGPVAIAVADFNGDTKPDLAAANVFSHDVSILIGTGGSNFAAPTSINFYNPLKSGEKRSGPGAVVSADFNGDGKPDLAIANFFSQDISVMLGSSTGTFSARTNFPAGTRLMDMAAGDFNNDGKTDLAVLTNIPDSVVILLGNGDGSFAVSATFSAGSNPRSITVGDFNRDGRLDLAVSNLNSANVSILLGTGTGSFIGPTNFAAGPGPGGIATADFNGDGKSDLVVTNSFGGSSTIAVLLGNGSGGFDQPSSITVGNTPVSVAVGDFDGDGRKDLAVVNQLSNDLWVLLGTGTGSFKKQVIIPLGLNPSFVIVRDINNDGTDDIGVAVNRGNVISILLNAGSAVFAGPFNSYAGASPTAMAANDFDGDGKLDLVVTNQTSDTVTILRGIAPQLPTGTQFCASGYFTNESNKSVALFVSRGGDTTGAATVDYRTQDTDTFTVNCAAKQGTAFARCDFATVVGTLSFAAGETMKTFDVPIIDDSYAEGDETFSLVLSDPTGATLGSPATATVTIVDNDAVDGPNPILQTDNAGVAFFVRQHYLDFLGREPEAGEPWSAILRGCADQFNVDPNSPSAGCDRITVSGAFFGSPEFKDKGFYGIDFYRVAFGRLPQYSEFVTDLASLVGATAQEVFARRAAFANNFVQRPEFATVGALPNSGYVMTLMAGTNGQNYNLTSITTPDPANPDGTTKVTLTTNDLINALNANSLTRAQVLRAIVQSDQIVNIEAVSTFVASQYYGYLRRTPEPSGFNAWVNYLTAHPTDFRTMVNGFMNSIEYRLRFGPS